MNLWKERIVAAFCMIGLAILTVVVFIGYEAYQRWDVIAFAFSHPQLVQTVKAQYASGEAELVKKLTVKEVSPDDKLKEALAESLKK